MAELKKSFDDYTELEFSDFINDIWFVRSTSEREHNSWIMHFRKITEHPRGSDLFCYPLPDEDCSPEGIVNTVKKWRAENGKSGLKAE